MSLYIPEWFNGPDQFLMFANYAWEPKVICTPKDIDNNTIKTYVTFFDLDMLKSFILSMDDTIKNQFTQRLNLASALIFKKIHLTTFLEVNLKVVHQACDGDFEKTTDVMSDLFSRMILDFEFWNRRDIVDLYTNYIFYGTFEDMKAILFLAPPMSSWDHSVGSWSSSEE